MLYYHGSNKKFDNFDLNFSNTGKGSVIKAIHLTPHFKYAENIALELKGEGKGYIYFVKIKSLDPNIEYKESMHNICFRSFEDLEIVDCLELL